MTTSVPPSDLNAGVTPFSVNSRKNRSAEMASTATGKSVMYASFLMPSASANSDVDNNVTATAASRIDNDGECSSCRLWNSRRTRAATTTTIKTPSTPHRSPVSVQAAAINAGRKVPKVGMPITLRKMTTTSAPTGSINNVFNSMNVSPSLSNNAHTLKNLNDVFAFGDGTNVVSVS